MVKDRYITHSNTHFRCVVCCRYIFSVEKQSGVLHPATVVDLVHDKCMDAAEQAFLAREPERKLTAGRQ